MQVLLSVAVKLVDLTESFIIQLEVYYIEQFIIIEHYSAALMQLTVSASDMLVTIFIVFMHVGISVAAMQVVLAAVPNCFHCKMQVTVSIIAM